MQNKFLQLSEFLKSKEKQGICLAFSGGIDSTLLLYLCKGLKKVSAVTFRSIFQSEEEIELCQHLASKYDMNHVIIDINPLESPDLAKNPQNRCYLCKKIFFSRLTDFAKSQNLEYIIDGTNFDDIHSFRPGLKALKELNISSPLAEFKITKQEIRMYAEEIGIEIAQKPSTPCLATRFPYGTRLDAEKINIVKQGENILKSFGFEANRLRLHDNIARIEIEKSRFNDFLARKDEIVKALKSTGITYITLDLEGLRSGSMDI